MPLIIKVPWLQTPRRVAALVELVDLAPTIWELAGLSSPLDETFDGLSLVSLLSGEKTIIKPAAFSQYVLHCCLLSLALLPFSSFDRSPTCVLTTVWNHVS